MKGNPKYIQSLTFKKKKSKKRFAIKSILLILLISIIGLITKCTFNKQDTKAISTNDTNSKVALEKEPKFTVCIDAGHGGYDNGCNNSYKVYEKEITLSIALKIGEFLEKENKDIKVIYTRTSDNVPWPSDNKSDLRERVKISNDAKADVFVSIHCNGNANTSYKGIETWCRFPNSEGEKLAKSLQKELVNTNYSNDRGIKYESSGSLAVLKLNNAVSSLIEIGFLTNSSDANFISSEKGQTTCANSIGKGILNYLSLDT